MGLVQFLIRLNLFYKMNSCFFKCLCGKKNDCFMSIIEIKKFVLESCYLFEHAQKSNSYSLSFFSSSITRSKHFDLLETCQTHMGFACFLHIGSLQKKMNASFLVHSHYFFDCFQLANNYMNLF